ncbi:MAG TPA: hypothetical protein VNL71_03785 [Chloroflexota bacterium]|nr:hypothetical protein [Chloroflexota bacterium]
MAKKHVSTAVLAGIIALSAPMPLNQSAVAAPLQWTGTIIESLTTNYSQTGADSVQVTESCHTTITFNADGSADADSTYNYSRKEDNHPSPNYETKTITQAIGPGTAHYTGNLSVTIAPDSMYLVTYSPGPSFSVSQTTTTTSTGQQTSVSNTIRYVSCAYGASLRGAATSQTSVNGQTSVNNPTGEPGTYTVTWHLSTAANGAGANGGSGSQSGAGSGSQSGGKSQDKPKITIKATNHGIDAGLSYKGIDISYSQDWTASQKKAGTAPTITSPGQNVKMTVDESPATKPPAAVAKGVASASAHGGGGTATPKISSQPFANGQLVGVLDTFKRPGSPDTWVVVVAGSGANQVVILMDIKPNTPPQQLLEAGAALASISLTGQ